ncbi:Cof-type HAD-IIB family hydrolase [Ruminococcus sp.]|uniref:Cof-type HAD-IIB family hydrolase n=1 Tax=Ruminococcus sp. TaxID=41978 RepID=UPI0025E0FDDF|nr:Cof-type HAD-IIB family hydrolase [Ruminococcus sp.]MBQ8965774.1 Cof-type HAD-IIB family hydrolase [Ruminococcus sp.]
MKKIMFFDIDGTLIPERHGAPVPESTLKALELARSAGHLLYVNTGRPAVNVDDDVRSLGFNGYVYGCGTMVVCEGSEIYYNTVEKDLCMSTVSLLRECDAVPMFERRDTVFFDFQMRHLPMIDRVRRGFAEQGKNVDRSTEDEYFSFDKFIICYDEYTNLDRLKPLIEKDFAWIHRGEGFAEIVPRPCSKASGIELVLEHYGIPRENAFAVGDSLNDLPMFSAVGTGIAMGNGHDLIPHAQYVTDDVDNNGIYNAMEHFGFF